MTALNDKQNTLVKALALALASAVFLSWLASKTILAEQLRWNSWALAEWVTNYSGGFIRRGLAGEILLRLFPDEPALPKLQWVVFLAAGSYFVIWAALLALCRAISWQVALLSLLLPGQMIHGVWINQYFDRKEVLYILVPLFLALSIATIKSRSGLLICLVLGSIFSVLATLLHEAYFVTTLPLLFLLNRTILRKLGGALEGANIWELLLLAPAALAFALCILYPGDPSAAEAIWQSVHPADAAHFNYIRQHPGPTTFATVGEPPLHAMAMAALIWAEGHAGIWLAMAAAAYAAIFAWFRLAASSQLPGQTEQVECCFWIVVFTLPVFLVAEDWGRYFVFAMRNIQIWLLVSLFLPAAPGLLPVRLRRGPQVQISRFIAANLGHLPAKFAGAWVMAWFWFFSLPICCLRNGKNGNVFAALPYVEKLKLFFLDWYY